MKTQSIVKQKKDKRNREILRLWDAHYEEGKTQLTVLAQSIADKVGCSLSTVNRIARKTIDVVS